MEWLEKNIEYINQTTVIIPAEQVLKLLIEGLRAYSYPVPDKRDINKMDLQYNTDNRGEVTSITLTWEW